jgi:hypothetical protein
VCLVPATNILIFKLIEFCVSQEISHTADACEPRLASSSDTSLMWSGSGRSVEGCHVVQCDDGNSTSTFRSGSNSRTKKPS